MPTYTDDDLDRNVLYFLKQHRGKENPLGRWELVSKVFGPAAALQRDDKNSADRDVRASVRRLRRAGALICDLGDGRGRFMADSIEEYQSFRQYFAAGVFEKMETLREMDKAAEQVWQNPLQPGLI